VKGTSLSVFIAVSILCCSPAFADTITVPGDQPTIQAGIDAAVNMDTVLVSSGTYVENIDFSGKLITLESASGAASTTIDGNDAGPVVTFENSETASAVIDGFTITNGFASYGGGIYCSGASPTIQDCTVSDSSADRGGGIYCNSSSATVTGCTITGNEATQDWQGGGGIYITGGGSNPTISQCTISSNSATGSDGEGGAIHCSDGTQTITNCVITGNSSTRKAGAIYCEASDSEIRHCTFSGNSGTHGGVLYPEDATVTFTNCILWGDISTSDPDYNEIHPGWSSTVTITYSDVEGGYEGTGNIDSDPLFVGGGDYHITSSSPCANVAVDVGIYTDLDGDGRPDGAGYDMGADETTSCGSSPTIAVPGDCATIQVGINAAVNGDAVLVSSGTYVENIDFNGKLITLESASGAASTTIDGSDAGPAVTFDNSETASAVIDGFTITNGSAEFGGGIYCDGASPTIQTCTISNSSADRGGGIYCNNFTSTITGCTITGNEATEDWQGGGGVYITGAGSDPTISECTISSNSTTGSDGEGGGLRCGGGTQTITNCVITGNSSSRKAGAIYSEASDTEIRHCTFSGNSGTHGGVLYPFETTVTFTNCILWGDSASSSEDEIHPGWMSTVTVTYSDVEGGYTGTGNIDSDPLFAGGGDYKITTGSPCIDTGTDAGVVADRDGTERPQYSGYDMGAYEYYDPMAVELVRFEAVPGSLGIVLAWETASEIDSAGFHLWRSASAGEPFDRITAEMIAAEGGLFWGASYTYEDLEVEMGRTYWYKLEDIDVYGRSTFHGPVEAATPTACGVVDGPGDRFGALWLLVLAIPVALVAAGRKRPAKKRTGRWGSMPRMG